MTRVRIAEEAPLADIRSSVAKKVVLSLSVGCAITWLLYTYFPFGLPNMDHPTDRVVFTLRCNVPSVLSMGSAIVYIGNKRFMSDQINPLSSKDRHLIEVPQRVLQNTLEQFVLSFTLQLAASTWMTSEQMKLIPIITMWFVLGRILFWVGYSNPDYARTKRSLGFSLTFQPSALLAIYCISKMISLT